MYGQLEMEVSKGIILYTSISRYVFTCVCLCYAVVLHSENSLLNCTIVCIQHFVSASHNANKTAAKSYNFTFVLDFFYVEEKFCYTVIEFIFQLISCNISNIKQNIFFLKKKKKVFFNCSFTMTLQFFSEKIYITI